MKAQKASAITAKANDFNASTGFKSDIYFMIAAKAYKGSPFIRINHKIIDKVKDDLEANGYTIQEAYDIDGTFITTVISWFGKPSKP